MRQLVAILFTDIVGYSRQMDLDEQAALRRLDQHNHLMDEVIRRHEGRVIKTVGDAYVVVCTTPSRGRETGFLCAWGSMPATW